MYKIGKNKQHINTHINKLLKSNNINDLTVLAHLFGNLKNKKIKQKLIQSAYHNDDFIKLIALFGLIKTHFYKNNTKLINLLLYGDNVIFNKGIELLSSLDKKTKSHIAKNLMPVNIISTIPHSKTGTELIKRLKKIYKTCEADDEYNGILTLEQSLNPIT